jgi:hypothetical protein
MLQLVKENLGCYEYSFDELKQSNVSVSLDWREEACSSKLSAARNSSAKAPVKI